MAPIGLHYMGKNEKFSTALNNTIIETRPVALKLVKYHLIKYFNFQV